MLGGMPNRPRVGLVQITIRIDEELAARLEKAVERFRIEHPGVKFDRSDAIRGALAKGLPPLEGPAPAQPVAKRKARG